MTLTVTRAPTQAPTGAIYGLTAREHQVLALMAEGRSNAELCLALVLSPKTVETHVAQIFRKLGLETSAAGHRRVLAVLAYLGR